MHCRACGATRAVIAATLLTTSASAQESAGQQATEATHFIETPKGWVHPRTAWGDPDLEGMWPISYVGSVPLERCAGFGERRGGDEPCDPNKAFLTEEEYQARLAAAIKQGCPFGKPA